MRHMWLITGLMVGTAQAQSTDLNAQMQHCLAMSQDQARLQCYDQLARSLNTLAAVPAVPAVPATVTPAADPVDSFGLENRAPEQQVDDLRLEVKSVRLTKKGRAEITMQNGQIWLQSDDSRLDIKAGDVCTIERAMLGSFLLNNGRSNRKIRVRRVD